MYVCVQVQVIVCLTEFAYLLRVLCVQSEGKLLNVFFTDKADKHAAYNAAKVAKRASLKVCLL